MPLLLVDFLVAISAATILTWGRYGSIVFPFPLNPDEAQAAANALIIKRYGIGWDVVDGGSCGVLHSLVTCWPYLFHGDVTYTTLRLTAVALLSLSTLFLFLTIRKTSGLVPALAASFLFCLFFAVTNHPDFLHYNSEFLPLMLILLANFTAVSLFSSALGTKAALAASLLVGLCFSSVFFSKLQAMPIALIVLLFCCNTIWRKHKATRARLFATCALGLFIPFALIFMTMRSPSALNDFYTSYLLWGLQYSRTMLSILQFHFLLTTDENLSNITYFALLICIFAAAYRSIFLIKTDKTDRELTTYYLILLFSTIVCIIKPGRMFSHYLTFLLPPLLLAASALNTSLFRNDRASIYYIISTSIICFLIVLDPIITFMIQKYKGNDPYNTVLPAVAHFKNENIFSWLDVTSKDSMLVWAWMPQWYALGPATPATRKTQMHEEITPSPLLGYFQNRFFQDLQRTHPDFIIDGVTEKSFDMKDARSQDVHAFPALSAILDADFTRLANKPFSHDACPSIYVRNARYRQLRQRLIGFKSVTASEQRPTGYEAFAPGNVADYSVTEDVCHDYWLLPEGKLGALDIVFSHPEQVAEVRLLNTNNGMQFDRAAETIRLSLYNEGKLAFTDTLTLHQHPKWTQYTLGKPVTADAMRIDILSFRGRGAGLNEVVALRATP